jgi:pathogenesis-related protein 1
MKTLKLYLLCALVTLVVHAQSTSDWIRLNDGTVYYGTYISSDGHTVHFRMKDDGIDHEFASSNVQSVYIANPALKQPVHAPAKPQPPIPPMSPIDQLFSGRDYAKYVSPAVRSCMQGPLPAVPSSTGSRVSVNQAELALQFHNCARKEVGTPPIQWSPALAAEAQKWSEHLASTVCKMIHTPNNPYGQNIFSGNGKFYDAFDASQAWYSERTTGHFQNNYVGGQDTVAVGHYTQVIWKSTTAVGIGQASCPNSMVIITADYSPPGNYLGQKAY